MNVSLMAIVLWAAGFILNAALLFVLVYKRRYRIVPWFTAWMATELAYNIALFLGYRFGSKHLYSILYWSSDFVDVSLQIAVVLELAATVLRRSGRWVEGARIRLGLMGATAPLVALTMALLMHPAARNRLDTWDARSSLFTTILIFLLFIGVVAASHQLGLGWQSYAMRESYGLVLWVMAAFITDTLHAYWRTLGHFTLLENIRIAVFQGVSIYWCIAFWLPEPEPIVMTPENINRLEVLKRQLEYGQQSSSSSDGVHPK